MTNLTSTNDGRPAEWPPRPADVWSDKDGDVWMALGDHAGNVELALSKGDTHAWQDPDDILESYGPMRLEYRPEVKVDERAERVAALRDLADMLDRNQGLAEPRRITIGAGSPEGLRRWAFALGVQTTAHPYGDTIQWWADKTIRGLEIHAYWIDDSPSLAADVPSVEEYERATAADVVAAATDDRGDAERIADACDCFAPVLPDGWVPYIGGGYIHEPTGNLSREIPTQRDPNPPFLADGTPNSSAG